MKKHTIIYKTIWWIYIALLLLVVIIKFRGSFGELENKIIATPFGTNYNLIPFNSIGEQLAHISEGWARFNLLGNIIPFVPFGFLLPITYPKANSFLKVLMVSLLFLFLMETFQFITRLGSFDIDDIILNTIGIIIGYFIACFIQYLWRTTK